MTSRKRTNTAAASSDGAIVKIVYFDEGSAADYVQIEHGGALDNVTTLLDQASSSGTAGVQGEASAKTKLLKALFGVGVSGDIEGSFNKSFVSGTIVKSIISNTVLTDFLNTVESSESSTSSIVELDKLRIEKIPGSISSMTLLTPYFSMFRNGQGIPSGDFDISIDKLDATLSKAKGYLEFLGSPGDKGKDVLLRFNSAAFKNNYRPSDLLRMNLKLYAVKVGKCSLSDLEVNNELAIEGFPSTDNPDYTEDVIDDSATDEDLDMYDVVLAGVRPDGK